MGQDVAYFVLGATLSVALAAIAVFYFRRHRKERIEGPKYKMLEDDDSQR